MGLSLLAESWTWYAVVIFIVLFRFASRLYLLKSVRCLQPEDWLMLFVATIYTVLVVFMNIVAHVDTNLMMPGDIPNLTPEDIRSRVYGSKLVLLVEQCMITTQWGCKICLLLLYDKLTFGLKQQYAVKALGAYVVTTYIVMEILYFGVWCRPIQGYWQVPVANIQCSAAIHHLITNVAFNISSDIMMLAIPLPLLITSSLPPLKKAILCVLFGLGTFVILCAALNKYYSFTQPFSPIWTFWYIREASTAILVANIPNCWPLLRRIFGLRPFSSSGMTGGAETGMGGTVVNGMAVSISRREGLGHTRHQSVRIGSRDDVDGFGGGRGVRNKESQEAMNAERTSNKDVPLEIWQDMEVRVDGESGDERERERRRERRILDLESGESDLGYQNRTTVVANGI